MIINTTQMIINQLKVVSFVVFVKLITMVKTSEISICIVVIAFLMFALFVITLDFNSITEVIFKKFKLSMSKYNFFIVMFIDNVEKNISKRLNS